MFTRPFMAAVAVTLLVANSARSADLKSADILVTDNFLDAVIKIDALSGNTELVSMGGDLWTPTGVTLGPDGMIYVADAKSMMDGSLVIRIDPADGRQTVVGQMLTDHTGGITFGSDGLIYVAGYNSWPTSVGEVVQIDPSNGNVAYYHGFGQFEHPEGVYPGPEGTIYVADSQAFDNQGGVLILDPATGLAYEESSGGDFLNPTDLTVMPNGDLAVLDRSAYGVYNPFLVSAGALIMVDPTQPSWANQTSITYYGLMDRPAAVGRTWHGTLLVLDNGMIINVNPRNPHNQTGANQNVAYAYGFLANATDMYIMPGVRLQRITGPVPRPIFNVR